MEELTGESFALTNSGQTRSTPLLSISRRGGTRYRSVVVTSAEVPFAAFARLRPSVCFERGAGRKRASSHDEHTQERVLEEVRRLSFSDPRKLFRKDGTPIPITELDDDTAAMISAIEVDADGRLRRIRLWDKNAALEKAMNTSASTSAPTPSGRRT